MALWTCIYDYGTWQQRKSGLVSWSDKRSRSLEALEVGDVVAPYIARIGWVGLWTVETRVRNSPEESAFGSDYPLIAEVDEELLLQPETAMQPSDLPVPSGLRQGDGDGHAMPYLFQASGISLSPEAGEELEALLRRWADAPVSRPLASRQTSYRAGSKASTSAGVVTIPDDDDTDGGDDEVVDDQPQTREPIGTPTNHSVAQRKLLELGSVLGFTPWVTPDDQSKLAYEDGRRMLDLTDVTSSLPSQFDDATNQTVRHIDAMWLNRARIEAAFEIENSTSIYSGILRMADLLALQPNIDIPLFIVVPEERLDLALQQLRRPVFVNMQRPLHEMCSVLTYDALEDLTELATKAGGSLRADVLTRYAVSADER